MRLSRIIFISLCLLLLPLATSAAPPEALTVKGIRFGQQSEDTTRIVIDLNQKADFRAFHLDGPYRIVVDLPATKWGVSKTKLFTSSLLKGYRSGSLDDGLTRIIFDIRKPALITNIFALPKSDEGLDRIVLDVHQASQNLFVARKPDVLGNQNLKGSGKQALEQSSFRAEQDEQAEEAKPQLASATTAVPQLDKTQCPKPYTIVLDAGHGGDDPGASGSGTKEKFVTLSIVREIQRQLQETGRYKVVLTRNKDVYIRLRDRLDLARKAHADLFVSIHADKINRDGVRGASIYTLSETASDAETERLAEEENNSGVVAGVDLAAESQDVADILLDLAMRDKMNESNLFAKLLERSFWRKNVRLLPNSHRSAGFAVLKAPDVPAVLVETGFLSNPDEVKLLNSNMFQQQISSAVVDGIDAYFRKIEALEKI